MFGRESTIVEDITHCSQTELLHTNFYLQIRSEILALMDGLMNKIFNSVKRDVIC